VGRRAPGFDLVAAVRDPGFTPARGDVPGLLDLLAGGPAEVREHAERALRRAGGPALEAAMERAKEAPAGARARLVGLVGRLHEAGPGARAFLLEALSDPDAAVRRRAADGLGRARADGEIGAALAAALGRETSDTARAALVAALGKVGGDAAQEALAASGGGARDARTDGELRKARVRAARPGAREEASAIEVGRPPERPVRVWLECRRGLLPVLLEEAAALGPRLAHRADGSAVAEVALAGPLEALFGSRTWHTAALAGEPVRAPDPTAAAARAIAVGRAHDAAAGWTQGPLRYRIAWASGGKRRAEVYRVAEAAAALDPALINDPAGAPWEVVLRQTASGVSAEWTPALADPRFAYRRGDVPAASHPTIAAALAFLAGAREEDVVWDPFVGSGLELCERALRGPYRRLVGTDTDPSALEVAHANLTSCGAARFDLSHHDVAAGAPKGLRPTLVITNPPMGRRVHRHADLRPLLRGFVASVARALAPGGRLVWVSPYPADTRAAASQAGLAVQRAHVVDMGGFDAEIQVFR
jgi:predicted RNA methylase